MRAEDRAEIAKPQETPDRFNYDRKGLRRRAMQAGPSADHEAMFGRAAIGDQAGGRPGWRAGHAESFGVKEGGRPESKGRHGPWG